MKDSAQVSGKAAAMVIARISANTELTLKDGETIESQATSRIIKLMQLFDREQTMTSTDFTQIYEDMEEELLKHGDTERIKIIRNGEEMVGAEVGSVFATFGKPEEA